MSTDKVILKYIETILKHIFGLKKISELKQLILKIHYETYGKHDLFASLEHPPGSYDSNGFYSYMANPAEYESQLIQELAKIGIQMDSMVQEPRGRDSTYYFAMVQNPLLSPRPEKPSPASFWGVFERRRTSAYEGLRQKFQEAIQDPNWTKIVLQSEGLYCENFDRIRKEFSSELRPEYSYSNEENSRGYFLIIKKPKTAPTLEDFMLNF